MMKKLTKILVVFSAILAIAFLILRVADTDVELMVAKYGREAVRIDDGVGGTLYYRDQGPSNAPVLLLLHGSNASMHTWDDVINKLKDRYRLISYDQHGHGLTGPHPKHDYSASAKIDTASRVLDAAGVDQAIWVGNSMGGWVTWRAALAAPERVKGLVVIDASGVQGGEEPKLYLGAKLMRSKIGQQLARFITPRSLIKNSIEANYFDQTKITEALIDRYWELLRFPGNRDSIPYRVQTSRELHYWDKASAIQQPTLVMWGRHDQVTPFSNARLFNQKINNSELIVYDNASHLPMEEIPQQVASDIDQWLQTHFIEPVLP